MTCTAEPFQGWHLGAMRVQPAQARAVEQLTPEQRASLASPLSWTLFEGSRPIVCAGVAEIWRDRGLLWSYLSADVTPRVFRIVHRHAKMLLTLVPYRRVEATAVCGFEPGHRWLRTLGFEMECPRMAAYDPLGNDHALYALVRQ